MVTEVQCATQIIDEDYAQWMVIRWVYVFSFEEVALCLEESPSPDNKMHEEPFQRGTLLKLRARLEALVFFFILLLFSCPITGYSGAPSVASPDRQLVNDAVYASAGAR